MILWCGEITINKSSYVSHGRPCHPKTNNSHGPWFRVLKMVILFRLLVKYVAKLIPIHLVIEKILRQVYSQSRVKILFY